MESIISTVAPDTLEEVKKQDKSPAKTVKGSRS